MVIWYPVNVTKNSIIKILAKVLLYRSMTSSSTKAEVIRSFWCGIGRTTEKVVDRVDVFDGWWVESAPSGRLMTKQTSLGLSSSRSRKLLHWLSIQHQMTGILRGKFKCRFKVLAVDLGPPTIFVEFHVLVQPDVVWRQNMVQWTVLGG